MTDIELLEMLRRGDVLEALNGFMALYHSALIRRAETLIARYEVPLTPDEVVSDVWARFVMHDAKRQITSVKGLLISMVKSDIHQYWRRSRLSGEALPDIADPVSIESEIVSRDEAERLEREIILSSIVSNNHLVALMMRYKHDIEPAYIAAVLKLKPQSVPVILSTTKKRIRTYVTDPAYRPRTPKETDLWMYSLSSAYLSLSVLFAEILKTAKAGSP